MINLSILNESITSEDLRDFALAVKYCEASMMQAVISERLGKTQKRLSKATGQEAIDELNAIIKKLQKELESYTYTVDETLTVYNKVVDAMSVPNTEGFCNSPEAIVTLLNTIAAADNRKVAVHAIYTTDTDSLASLAEAMEYIHISASCDIDGMPLSSEDAKHFYVLASSMIDAFTRSTFNLPVETIYTKKIRVNLNNTDKKLLHETFVKSVRLSVKKDGENTQACGYKVQTAVRTRKVDGKEVKDYASLAALFIPFVLDKITLSEAEYLARKEQETAARKEVKKQERGQTSVSDKIDKMVASVFVA